MEHLIDRISPQLRELWPNHTVKLTHHLAGNDLFRDESLARLIDLVDPSLLGIKTMGAHCRDPLAWYRCGREGVSGADVLDAVRRGRIWINISAVHESEPRFTAILNGLYDEMEAQLPGFHATKRRLGLLISSPSAEVVYHADPLGQGLVQIRGRKRVWIYPTTPPFLPPQQIEDIVRGVTEEELSYEPWFDGHAEVHDLEPGEMLYWALNSPHRVTNYDCLNVSLTTEHWTKQVRSMYMMNFGNGLLRSHKITPRSRALSGPAFWTKVGLTAAQRLRRGSSNAMPAPVAYTVDPMSETGTRPVAGIQSEAQ